MTDRQGILSDIVGDLRRSWKPLALTDIIYKIIAFILLTPLVGGLFRAMLSFSGSAVLADQDILFFFLGPVGWVCFTLVGALWLGIVALEQSALLSILCASKQQHVGTSGALRFASANALPVIWVTARLLGYVLLVMAPFLVVAGVVYVTLLGDYDINFYMKEKPPAFVAALAIGGMLIVGLITLLLRLFSGWLFALPLVLFEGTPTSIALKESSRRAVGHRRKLLAWIVGWLLATALLSSLATGVVIGLGRFFVPRVTGSLGLMAGAIGVTMILWTLVNLAVNLLSTTSFAAMLFHLYRRLGREEDLDLATLNLPQDEVVGSGIQITRKRLLAAGIVGVFVAMLVGGFLMQSVRLEDHCSVTAHRGSSKAAPENTMAAVLQAIEDGADWVEIDVQETADGQVVVFHDSDFMKLSRSNLKIWDATMADLEKLDIGSWFSPEFKDQRVPTLAAVLQACKGKAGVNIELKYYGHDKDLEQRVIQIVETQDMVSEVVLMSLKLDAVEKLKALRPEWKVGLLMSVAAGNLANIEADFLAVNASFAHRPFILRAHDIDKEVYVWTVNDAPTMSTMIGRGVDSLITDKPALARAVLRQRAELSAAERLLLELAGMLGVEPELAEQ